MDWSNETYVRLYTRDTATWLKIRWQGQCLFMQLLRKVDRSGRLDGITDTIDDLSLITGLPDDVVETGLEKLQKFGVVEINDEILVIPNYIEAQTASKSDKQRQRESRENRRNMAVNGKDKPTKNTKKVSYSEEVEIIWAQTPRMGRQRSSKKNLQNAWDATNPKPEIEKILSSLEDYKKTHDWKKNNGEYVGGIHIWVKDRKWEVDIDLSQPPQSNLSGFNGERLTAAEQMQRRNRETLDRLERGEIK